jgi:hypothetical protein
MCFTCLALFIRRNALKNCLMRGGGGSCTLLLTCYLLIGPPWPSWSAWRTSALLTALSGLPSFRAVAHVLAPRVALVFRYASLKLPATVKVLIVAVIFRDAPDTVFAGYPAGRISG